MTVKKMLRVAMPDTAHAIDIACSDVESAEDVILISVPEPGGSPVESDSPERSPASAAVDHSHL